MLARWNICVVRIAALRRPMSVADGTATQQTLRSDAISNVWLREFLKVSPAEA